MFFETRLTRYLGVVQKYLTGKLFTVQNTLSLVLFSLFSGFLFGNLFGTFLDSLRLYFFCNGFVGLFILLLVESINSLVYGISFSRKFEYDGTNLLQKKEISLQGEFNGKRSPTPLTPVPPELLSKSPKEGSGSLLPQKGDSPVLTGISIFKDCTLLEKKVFFLYQNITYIKRIVNSFKIGLLFGFFVDSFKVGS